MSTNKIIAAKNGLNSMIGCYYQALLESGCSDPKQIIATDIVDMIKLSCRQSEYIIDNFQGGSAKDMLTNIIILLTKMEKDNKIDSTAMTLIKQNIEIIIKMIRA